MALGRMTLRRVALGRMTLGEVSATFGVFVRLQITNFDGFLVFHINFPVLVLLLLLIG
jgi:hypothetical protein